MKIVKAQEKHFDQIVALNHAEVQYTSPMDLAKTKLLDSLASDHLVAEIDDNVAGFLLVMDHDSKYENDNHQWFRNLYSQFLYVDRIVVNKNYFGQKVGSGLYQYLIEQAQSRGIENIVCEYNIKPMNYPSKKFHDRFGFEEVGQMWAKNNEKQVSMQRLKVKL